MEVSLRVALCNYIFINFIVKMNNIPTVVVLSSPALDLVSTRLEFCLVG